MTWSYTARTRHSEWRQLHEVLLDQPGLDSQLDCPPAGLDSLSARQVRGRANGRTDRPRKPRSKYHLLVDRGGIPLAAGLSAANSG